MRRERMLVDARASTSLTPASLSEVANGKSRIDPIRDRQLLTVLQEELQDGGSRGRRHSGEEPDFAGARGDPLP